MNFVVDAQLPQGLCEILARGGHDAIHTLQLPLQNKTPDRLLNELSFVEQRVVVTKDTDFFYSHLLQGRPWKLLLIRTGNARTRELKTLFERNLPGIVAALQNHSLVELDWVSVRPVL